MTKPTAILSAVALLVHALAGCCWHHEHSVQAGGSPEVAEHGCEGHDHEHGADGLDGKEEPAGEHCRGSSCVTVASRIVTPPSPWLSGFSAAWSDSRKHGGGCIARCALSSGAIDWRPPPAPFDFHQILLI